MDQRSATSEPSLPVEPQLCSAGCGFYSNPLTCGSLCSKCFSLQHKDAELSKQAPFSEAPSASKGGREAASASVGPLAAIISGEAAAAEQQARSTPQPAPQLQQAEAVSAPAAAAGVSAEEPSPRKPQRPGRCYLCNKKVGLTGFRCRCDSVFCGAHRLAEAHSCPFDYKSMERERLVKNNPLVQASKLDKF